jgi:NAD(P)-dependent dehydrogenase (short-subunit alcohol dehydrogenase family)
MRAFGGELNEVADMSGEGWQRVVELNLPGAFFAPRALPPRMLEAGGGAHGRIDKWTAGQSA